MIESEQALAAANHELITRFEQMIQATPCGSGSRIQQ
jgi:hypothetical protein